MVKHHVYTYVYNYVNTYVYTYVYTMFTTYVYTFGGWRDFAPFCFHFFGGGGGSGVNGKAPCVHLCLQLC